MNNLRNGKVNFPGLKRYIIKVEKSESILLKRILKLIEKIKRIENIKLQDEGYEYIQNFFDNFSSDYYRIPILHKLLYLDMQPFSSILQKYSEYIKVLGRTEIISIFDKPKVCYLNSYEIEYFNNLSDNFKYDPEIIAHYAGFVYKTIGYRKIKVPKIIDYGDNGYLGGPYYHIYEEDAEETFIKNDVGNVIKLINNNFEKKDLIIKEISKINIELYEDVLQNYI